MLYHFTDRRNLPEIQNQGGLLPRSMIKNVFIPGGNQWSIDADNYSGMNNYVHLCFLKDHPMEYSARDKGRIDPVWLAISTDVLDIPGVLYCAGVSNASGAQLINTQEAIFSMDFDHLFNWHDFHIEENRILHNNAKKYEILVPSIIPLNLIIGLA
jgi:hypothetical protein